jgi:hypothetical protein
VSSGRASLPLATPFRMYKTSHKVNTNRRRRATEHHLRAKPCPPAPIHARTPVRDHPLVFVLRIGFVVRDQVREVRAE